jgi:glycerol-1-phosphate dehydrogenase [NAD(P)+]
MKTTDMKAALGLVEDTDEVVIRPGAARESGNVIRRVWPHAREAVLVADRNTWDVAGETVALALREAGISTSSHVFGERNLKADYSKVEELREVLNKTSGIPVAIGSGTLNDLTKLASEECGRRYAVVATAASMDGYTSFGASITRDKVKQTIFCRAPRAVIADTDILMGAPPEMTAAGYADLLAKTTAGADWILADTLGIEPIHETAWSFVQPRLPDWTANPDGLLTGNASAFSALLEGLIMAGLAMQVARSSRPASGAEHLFSHLWDMQGRTHEGKLASHGFKVGVGTLATRRLYDFLDTWNGNLDVEARCSGWPELQSRVAAARALHRDPYLADAAEKAIRAKHIDASELRRRVGILSKNWPDLKPTLARQLPSAEDLASKLSRVGAPVSASRIGIDKASLRESYLQAATIRDRYTILDLGYEMGFLEQVASSASFS